MGVVGSCLWNWGQGGGDLGVGEGGLFGRLESLGVVEFAKSGESMVRIIQSHDMKLENIYILKYTKI